MKKHAWLTLLCCGMLLPFGACAAGDAAEAKNAAAGLPRELKCGSWGKPAGHMQGAVADDENNYLYASFTDRLVKVDMHTGEVVASVTGLLAGGIYGGGAHMGDLAFHDGKVYGSLEYKAAEKFYVAVFDVSLMTKMDIDYKTPGVMTTLYMDEVVRDYVDDLSAGEHTNARESLGHRYGCSGIDGITFGTLPGDDSGKTYMLLAYGVYGNVARGDNDYQVILAFDPDTFDPRPFDQDNPHLIAPPVYQKLFVYTGNTRYGVQNLEFDRATGDYWMIVYTGEKDGFINCPVYVIDGKKAPVEKTLDLGGSADYGAVTAPVLSLKAMGSYHEASDVWGIAPMPGNADTGFISLGNDYFLVAQSGKIGDKQYGGVRLYRFDRAACAFARVE